MRKLFLLTGCVWTMLFTACDNTDYSDHSPFDNSAYLSVAEIRNVESFTFNRRVTEQTKKFTAKLTYPVGVDVTVRLQINPSLADAYNAKNDTQYEVLPARHYKLTAEAVTIPARKTTSSEAAIQFTGLDELEIDATYICPLTIEGVNEVGLMNGSRTMYYLVRRSSAITTAINLKNVYVAVPGFDKGSPTADVVNNMTAITMEVIVRVNQFEKEISSIMGIEQYLCMRFGDSSFPRQQLQVQTPVGKFPGEDKRKQLTAGEWYHIALTWDLAAKTICFYVNGQLQHIDNNHGKSDLTTLNLGDKAADNEFGNGGDFNFYFGRSYGESSDPSRHLDGEICEARIWKVARTQEEIYKNMYDIPEPQSEANLCAYWKFDEGTGMTIADRTGNGNDAKVIPYWKDATHVETYPKTDAELWPSGIEVPKVNQEQ